ncbi:hypothetical protein [Streptomyces sp. SCL15-4]|uniref:hypothetical protein n=1 Tax=Streptomyces sp. SCL15-4 TaxID=2967221 RepID=UPI002966A3FC|nr:hypothetical protein [Streptomyces sp. SCL15-4]
MDSAVCAVCSTGLYDTEQQTCRPCTERVAANLTALAGPEGLYARLSASLHPGSRTGGPAVSGSRTAPLPVRLEVLNAMTERGPVLGPLEGWVRDWEQYGRATVDEAGTLQQRLDHAVGTLRFNLAWAAGQHPAFADFADELWTITRRCRTAAGEEKPPVKVPVACRCGQILRISLDMDGIECRHCRAEYGHAEMLKLTPARRVAA